MVLVSIFLFGSIFLRGPFFVLWGVGLVLFALIFKRLTGVKINSIGLVTIPIIGIMSFLAEDYFVIGIIWCSTLTILLPIAVESRFLANE